MAKKYINRYRSFCDSLAGLQRARLRDPSDEFVLSGTVQKFYLTFDISWKVMKDIIINYHKIQDFATGSPRETLRTAYSVRLISDDSWMQMLDMRNALSHDYDGTFAQKCFSVILDEYLPLFERFQAVAEKYMSKLPA